MFLYSGNGETDGPARITNKEFFKKVANQYTDLLSTYTNEGLCYRVDLRLRPDGRYGEVCISLEGARGYYQVRARDWELQMLIKARVASPLKLLPPKTGISAPNSPRLWHQRLTSCLHLSTTMKSL